MRTQYNMPLYAVFCFTFPCKSGLPSVPVLSKSSLWNDSSSAAPQIQILTIVFILKFSLSRREEADPWWNMTCSNIVYKSGINKIDVIYWLEKFEPLKFSKTFSATRFSSSGVSNETRSIPWCLQKLRASHQDF